MSHCDAAEIRHQVQTGAVVELFDRRCDVETAGCKNNEWIYVLILLRLQRATRSITHR